MCHKCNYKEMMKEKGITPTTKRLNVMEVIGTNPSPLSAEDIYQILQRTHDINKVTVYRILDVLSSNHILEKLSAGDSSFRYGIAPNENHHRHAHFYCKICGRMECLNPNSVQVDYDSLNRVYSGIIERMEIRFDGTCKNCLHESL